MNGPVYLPLPLTDLFINRLCQLIWGATLYSLYTLPWYSHYIPMMLQFHPIISQFWKLKSTVILWIIPSAHLNFIKSIEFLLNHHEIPWNHHKIPIDHHLNRLITIIFQRPLDRPTLHKKPLQRPPGTSQCPRAPRPEDWKGMDLLHGKTIMNIWYGKTD